MKIEIELNLLKDIDIFGYIICLCLFKNETKSLESYCKLHPINLKSFEIAISNGYLSTTKGKDEDYTVSNIFLLPRFQEEFFPLKSGPEEWIDEYYNLFPKGVTSIAGYPIRTDKSDCLKKLIKFTNEFDYSKGVIITATKNYLNIQKRTNYSHCKQSNYLIYKDNLSVLSGLCEIIKDKISGEIQDDYKEDRL